MWLLNLATPGVLEVTNQFTPRHTVDTMAHLSNEDITDMTNDAANGNTRRPAIGCIRSVFPTDI